MEEKQKSEFLSGSFLREAAYASLAVFLVALAPYVGPVVLVFIPLPALFYWSKNGVAGGLAFIGASVLIALIAGKVFHVPHAVPSLIILSSSGVVMAEVLKRKYSVEKTVFTSVLAIFALGALFLLYQGFLLGETPWRVIEGYAERKIRASIDLYAYLNISSEKINLIKENISDVVAFIAGISPALAVVLMTFMVWINLLLARSIFPKYGLFYPDFGELSYWKAPEKLVWYLIAAGAMLLLPDGGAALIGWNVLIVILFIYLMAGVAIVGFFLKKSSLPAGFRYLAYFLIFAQQIVTIAVAAAGLFDLWVDFRKLNKKMEDTAA